MSQDSKPYTSTGCTTDDDENPQDPTGNDGGSGGPGHGGGGFGGNGGGGNSGGGGGDGDVGGDGGTSGGIGGGGDSSGGNFLNITPGKSGPDVSWLFPRYGWGAPPETTLAPPTTSASTSSAGTTSSNPVSYFSGEIMMPLSDIVSPRGLSHKRTYSNTLPQLHEGDNGNNWILDTVQKIQSSGASSYIHTKGKTEVKYIQVGSTTKYNAEFDSSEKWVLTKLTNGTFEIVCNDNGLTYAFHSLSESGNKAGSLKSITNTDDLELRAVTYDSNGYIQKIKQNYTVGSVTASEELEYTLYTSGDNINKIKDVVLRTASNIASPSWKYISKAAYEYYVTSDTDGAKNDLKLVTIYKSTNNASSSAWSAITNHHYRYRTNSLLKFVVGPQKYASLVADGNTPTTMTITSASNNYDHYFTYDAENRVLIEIAHNCVSCGGTGTGNAGETMERWMRDDTYTQGPNVWSRRIINTLASGIKEVVITNFKAQPILRYELDKQGVAQNYRYIKYGEVADSHQQYKVIMRADHAAINIAGSTLPTFTGDNKGTGSLSVDLNTSAGLVKYNTFFSTSVSSESDSGAAKGKIKEKRISNGYKTLLADRILTDSYAYWIKKISYSAGAQLAEHSIYSIETSTNIQDALAANSSTSTAGIQTTKWVYTDSETAPKMVKTYPAITTGESTTASGSETYTWNDKGQLVEFLDVLDTKTKHEFDDENGYLVKRTHNYQASYFRTLHHRIRIRCKRSSNKTDRPRTQSMYRWRR